jgi:hypothetical protein
MTTELKIDINNIQRKSLSKLNEKISHRKLERGTPLLHVNLKSIAEYRKHEKAIVRIQKTFRGYRVRYL